MFPRLLVVTLAATACCLAAEASPELWFKKPATAWREALPVGNGKLAAMVFGGVAEEHLQLNEETIFAGKRMDRSNPHAKEAVPVVRQLLLAGKVKEAEERAGKDLLAIPLHQPPYETLGDLKIAFPEVGETSAYRRSLDLYTGIARVEYTQGGVQYTREVFASYPDAVVIVHLASSGTQPLGATVALTREKDAEWKTDAAGNILMTGTALPPDDKNHQYAGEAGTGAHFAAGVRILNGGKSSRELTLLVAAASDVNVPDPVQAVKQTLDRASTKSFRALKQRHVADFGALATRVSLRLGDGADSRPTDELLASQDPALAALYFAYGRYLLQSSSRQNSLAANLQGKWNEQLNPAWGSKYTININTEMNYWPAETCNLGETVDGLVNLLHRMEPSGLRGARSMYGTEGMVAHHNTDVWGDTEPIDGVPYGVWPMGGAWLTLALWEHYDYSRDLEFLRRKAYPLMREAALFLEDNLFEDGAGHLVSGPSLSPENMYLLPDGQRASLDLSPTMDVEITQELFGDVIRASGILRTDAVLRQRLQAASARLMPLQIGKLGQLQEWRKDYAEAEPGHRHLSHLFGVYPGATINSSKPDYFKAARVSLERRLANGGGGTGWSRAWVTALWATFREGDQAADSLRVLFAQSTWPNLFDTHPPSIFQIDGNLGATAAIGQMLVQSRSNAGNEVEVDVLPALPHTWDRGAVKGMRIRGGATIDLTWENHQLVAALIHASVPVRLHLSASSQGATDLVELKAGEASRCKAGSPGQLACQTI